MQTGQRVRLRNDPGRTGILTGKSRIRLETVHWQVAFPDSTQYVPDDQIELLGNTSLNPVDMLEEGRFGRPVDLRRALTHVRLTGRLADVIYSMDVTGTDFYAYQFKPVIKILESPGNGVLIADEVGLGKTIEAGLIWTELRSRFDFRRIFVLCPAVLREKWQRELAVRFGVQTSILNAQDTLRRLQEAARQGYASSFGIIASMQGLRPRRGWNVHASGGGAGSDLARFLANRDQEEPLIDLLIVDEAHYLRNPETQTAILGRSLRNVAQYVSLLSATPIHLGSKDLLHLLQLIDEDTFSDQATFEAILEANRPLVTLREQLTAGKSTRDSFHEHLATALQNPLLSDSRQLALIRNDPPSDAQLLSPEYVSHLAHKLETVNLLGHVLTRTRKRSVTEWRVLREAKAISVPMTVAEADFYAAVTATVRQYCAKRDAHEGFLLVMPQRQMSSSMPAALKFWQSRAPMDDEQAFEDFGEDIDNDSVHTRPLLQNLIARSLTFGNYATLVAEDSKYSAFKQLLKDFRSKYPGAKAVVFAYFKATLHYLHDRLREDGIASIVLKGGDPDKDSTIETFRSQSGPDVLLSSEVGSEGIDLQFSWVVFNYDLPWNPMRVEQRIGRIDRLGQESPKVEIRNLFYADTIDARIYSRLLERLGVFERTLGSLEAIIGPVVRELTRDLLRQDLTPSEEEERIDQTRKALETKRRDEEKLEDEAAHLVAYGDYILNQVKAARELSRRIDSEDLQSYVTEFLTLHYPGTELRQVYDDPLLFHVNLSNSAKFDFEKFLHEFRIAPDTSLLRSDSRPIACRFKNNAVTGTRATEEMINQFHPLVRFVSHRLRSDQDADLAIAVRVVQSQIPVPLRLADYTFTVQKWSVRGIQDIEKLWYAACALDDRSALSAVDAERLVTHAASIGQDWLAAGTDVDLQRAVAVANDQCLGSSDAEYERFVRDVRARNDDRADVQQKTLERRAAGQLRRMEAVLDEHNRRARLGLAKATANRIDALRNRVEREQLRIKERRVLTASKSDVCVGVVRVSAMRDGW